MKKLTIGIPTYNSCDLLKETIENSIAQVESSEDVEILICDNASDDGTQTLIQGYLKDFPHLIRYIRHESNLGMDRNFWSIIQNAKGEFVHLHGADDFYTQDGVKRILDKIAIPDIDVILLSNNYLNTRNGKIIKNIEPETEDILCKEDGEAFFLRENLKTMCLSNTVIRKSRCYEITDIQKYFGCQWLHVALMTRIIKSTSTAYIFNFKRPIMTVRIGNQKWLEKDGAVVYYCKLLAVFEGLKNVGYADGIFEHIKTAMLPLVSNGRKINFNRTYMNVFYCFKFLRFYYNMPKQYVLLCAKLVLSKHRPFFEGWEHIGD